MTNWSGRPDWELKGSRERADTVYEMNTDVLTSTNNSANNETDSDGHILTTAEVALFLKVPKSTVYKLVRLGQIPARRIGKHWRFLGKDLQKLMQPGSNDPPQLKSSLPN
jgi:excisionase family DNA binding protein